MLLRTFIYPETVVLPPSAKVLQKVVGHTNFSVRVSQHMKFRLYGRLKIHLFILLVEFFSTLFVPQWSKNHFERAEGSGPDRWAGGNVVFFFLFVYVKLLSL